MGWHALFKSRKPLTLQQKKWNRLWQLWQQNQVSEPYAQIMEYDSQVNNGGHSQYFFNTDNCSDVHREAGVLLQALPEPLKENFRRAYASFCAQADVCEEDEALLSHCDQVFYDKEHLLLRMLEAYAETIEL